MKASKDIYTVCELYLHGHKPEKYVKIWETDNHAWIPENMTVIDVNERTKQQNRHNWYHSTFGKVPLHTLKNLLTAAQREIERDIS